MALGLGNGALVLGFLGWVFRDVCDLAGFRRIGGASLVRASHWEYGQQSSKCCLFCCTNLASLELQINPQGVSIPIPHALVLSSFLHLYFFFVFVLFVIGC